MTLPPLYEQNLILYSGDRSRLNSYKVGLMEHILKETLRMMESGESSDAVRASVSTAVEVAVWEPRRS